MIKSLKLLIFLLTYITCADHELFKNCSRVSFCKTLRESSPTSPLKAQLDGLARTETIITIPLTNSAQQDLNLQISLLPKLTARIKILEKDRKRYELVDVLEKEPDVLKVTVDNSTRGSISVVAADMNYTHKVVVTADPLSVEFYYDANTLQSVLKGDKLIFDTTEKSQAFAFGVEFQDAVRLYGLHHHAYDLELPTTKDSKITKMDPFRLRNSDTSGYEVGSPMALYGAVPAVYGHSKDTTSGIFLHNAAEQWIDISYSTSTASVYFMVERAALDLFVFLGNTPKDVVRQFSGLTGVAHMPQMWTLGYHQCRWSYWTQEEAKDVVAQMDAHDLPMDALWLDIDYTDGYRYFTWNPKNYSDPIGLQKNLSSTNRKLVTISDPHIKKDNNYAVYAQATGKHFVKWENGSDFEGSCWPGVSSYLDFLNPATRDFYASWYSYDKFNGSTPTLAGIWNDMNEPSVFDDSTEKTMPFELLHFGNVTHGDIHNIYGFLQTKATHQGLMQRDNGTKRPFVLTRSHFAGSQRYAAMWTGDNTADWPYLQVSYAECLLSNLVGHVFCGADTGGFAGDPEVELVERWYQAGIWLPFYRGHASIETQRREPYVYSEDVQKIIRTALRTRYMHIPVWYTLFYEHTITGDPIIRPLFYDYPGTVDKDQHILLGPNILARPVMEKGATAVDISFPGSTNTSWYRIDDNSFKVFKGGVNEKLPVDISSSPYFYKGGSVIARKDSPRSSTSAMYEDPFILYVNLDNNNEATGTLYIDDSESFEYQNNKLFCYISLTFIPETNGVQLAIIDGEGTEFPMYLSKVVIHKPESSSKSVFTSLADGTLLSDVEIMPHLTQHKKLILNL